MNTVAQVELDSLLAACGGAFVSGLAVMLACAHWAAIALTAGLGGVFAGLVIVAGP
jgi:hypothetical protein